MTPTDRAAALVTRAEPVGMVEIDAWVVVHDYDDGADLCVTAYNHEDDAGRARADALSRGRVAKIVRLVGHTAPPTREAVEVVVGEVDDG